MLYMLFSFSDRWYHWCYTHNTPWDSHRYRTWNLYQLTHGMHWYCFYCIPWGSDTLINGDINQGTSVQPWVELWTWQHSWHWFLSCCSWRLVTSTMYAAFIITTKHTCNYNVISKFFTSLALCHMGSTVCCLLIYVLLLQLSTPLTMRIFLDPKVRTIMFRYITQILLFCYCMAQLSILMMWFICHYFCFMWADGLKTSSTFILHPKHSFLIPCLFSGCLLVMLLLC
jgi:hypothetical protein